MSNKGRIYHKFDPITETCTVCGVIKRNVYLVGSGYNPNLKKMMGSEYSINGINFIKKYINCKNK